ncbi:hypothetical protein FRC00_001078 [Tulasnella sp. 408]|nr:hypothetical protein FRC00_001078 [Tulasnella sp. 408]
MAAMELPLKGREAKNGRFITILRRIQLAAVKRRARKLLDELIIATKGEDEPAVAQLQRFNAAAGLVMLVEEQPSGEEIVARRFVKRAPRIAEGTRALMKLSDDELVKLGYEAISTTSEPTASRKLLDALLNHSNESSFFRESILPQLRDGSEGPAAILYLASTKTYSFFAHIKDHVIFDFCKRIVGEQEVLSPKWCYTYLDPRNLNTEHGLGIFVLISFLKFPSVAKLFLDSELSRFGSFLVEVVLRLRTLDFEFADTDEKDILRHLTRQEDLYITCLCSLPAPAFSVAVSGALKEGMAQLNSRNTYSYKPLALVERLLWLSNVKKMEEQIHRALVEGRACECLAHALTYTGGLDPDDRGLWRAKGLAMTCLGNIIERMNKEQFCNCIREEIIASVVAIKEDAAAPLVQKGQAILLLQRYTLAADRLGVQPSHREDTSNVAEEFRGVDPGDLARPPSTTDCSITTPTTTTITTTSAAKTTFNTITANITITVTKLQHYYHHRLQYDHYHMYM